VLKNFTVSKKMLPLQMFTFEFTFGQSKDFRKHILAGFVYEKVYAATKADPAFCAGREDAPQSKMRQLLCHCNKAEKWPYG
ncbi:MAG: hypothetical protein Q3982_08560, partial [Phoenicibacter congonensis]|nr:hypothetical protein [Phoenicibacter congonensis]